VSALLDRVGDRPIEVLVNNAVFGSYGPFAEADPDRETDELAVDVGAVVALARAFLPGMLARGSGGILNVASTIAFQPAPYQAVYGANKAFVLSFSQALRAEARAAGVAVTALCPGPTRTGFVDALGADAGHAAIYRTLADPGPVIKAGLGALDQGRAVVIPGLRNKVIVTGGRFMPREWLTRVSGRLLRPASTARRPPIEVHNQILAPAPAERVWDLLTDVEGWPSWYRACRWVRVEPAGRPPEPDAGHDRGMEGRGRRFPERPVLRVPPQRGDLVLVRLDPPAPARLLQVGRDGRDRVAPRPARPVPAPAGHRSHGLRGHPAQPGPPETAADGGRGHDPGDEQRHLQRHLLGSPRVRHRRQRDRTPARPPAGGAAIRSCPGRLRGDRPGTARPGGRDGVGGGPAGRRFDDRWGWLVASIVPRFRRIDADTCLVAATLRRISAEASNLASVPCVLPAAASRRP
jgi:short-subunit dehydrogenase